MVLVLSGCFFGGSKPDVTTGTDVAADLLPYYTQKVTWKVCDNGAECATVLAPMDWSNPSADTDITLALARQRAQGTKLGSLFVNPGGPGHPATTSCTTTSTSLSTATFARIST